MHMLTGMWLGLKIGSGACTFALTLTCCMLDKAEAESECKAGMIKNYLGRDDNQCLCGPLPEYYHALHAVLCIDSEKRCVAFQDVCKTIAL